MASESTLRFLKVDYQSHKDAILSRIRSRWPLIWNDFLSNSIGIVLVDIIAWSTATIAYIINRIASENFISTMTLRESAVRLGSLVGYQLRGATPATVLCEATIPAPVSKDVLIPGGTVVRVGGSSDIAYEVSQDYLIKSGDLTPKEDIVTFSTILTGTSVLSTQVTVANGSLFADLVDSTIDLNLFISPGQSFQRISDNGDVLDTAETLVYIISAIEAAPGAVSNNRIVLTTPWTGTSEAIAAKVFETRIGLVQGQTITDRFLSPAVETPNFVIRLTRTDVIDGSISVTVNSEKWTQVPSNATQGADAHTYEVKTLTTGQVVIIFGDGIFGATVPTESTILATYRVGGGTVGNISTGTINGSLIGIIQSLNTPTTVNVSNFSASGVGGQDPETLEEARSNIPAFTRTNDRAVTLDDYATTAQNFSSPTSGRVKFARATVRTENALLEGNIVIIYAWTSGSGGGLVPLPSNLKQELTNFMQTKALGTDFVIIADGDARPAPIALRFLTFDGFDVDTTAQLIRDTLKATINNLKPGAPVIYSNLVRQLDEVFGVDTVTMATPVNDLVTDNNAQIFTPPDDATLYPLQLVSSGGLNSTAQMPFAPASVWSLRAFFGSTEILVIPDTVPGFARLLDPSLVDYRTGLTSELPNPVLNTGLFFLATDSGTLYRSNGTAWLSQPAGTASKSTINLLTGQVNLSTPGTPGTFQVSLKTVAGYNRSRPVNIYVGYTGLDNSATKRHEIRAALRAWSEQVDVAGSIFAREISGLSASRSNVTDVVRAVSTVTGVTRVALDTPGNNSPRIDATDFELLTLGQIVLNNNAN